MLFSIVSNSNGRVAPFFSKIGYEYASIIGRNSFKTPRVSTYSAEARRSRLKSVNVESTRTTNSRMTMDKSQMPKNGGNNNSTPQECAGCGKQITERYLLKALDMYWHEDCLKCGCCDCRLGEVGSTLFTKANLILCRRDYLRLFGNTGYCSACSKVIPAFEMVMRARNNVYHLECFACQQCNHRFCVGDRFYLCENKILCEYDYEERMVFANMAYNPPNIAQLKRHTSHIPVSPSRNPALPGVRPNESNDRRQTNGDIHHSNHPMTNGHHFPGQTESPLLYDAK